MGLVGSEELHKQASHVAARPGSPLVSLQGCQLQLVFKLHTEMVQALQFPEQYQSPGTAATRHLHDQWYLHSAETLHIVEGKTFPNILIPPHEIMVLLLAKQ